MERVVIFTDMTTITVPTILTEATLRAVEKREDMQVVGVCVRRPKSHASLVFKHFRRELGRRIRHSLDPEWCQTLKMPWPLNLNKLSRRYGFQILTPSDDNMNHPDFLVRLETTLKPTIALSYFAHQRFSRAFLHVFEYAVNYHNGLLPEYGGIGGTSWSVYDGRSTTGYTFHRMNDRLDEGNILIQGAIDVRDDAGIEELEYEKAFKAAGDISSMLDMAAGREKGIRQETETIYYPHKATLEAIRLKDPTQHSKEELMRRLRAFGLLILRINGTWYDVSKLKEDPGSEKTGSKRAFKTADGATLKPVLFWNLPYSVYRVLKRFGKSFPSITQT